MKFINGDASSIHGSIKIGAIYTSDSGEWRLGGFDVLSSVKDDESIIYVRWAAPSLLPSQLIISARLTAVLYQTQPDTLPQKSVRGVGKWSRRTLTQRWMPLISEPSSTKLSMANSTAGTRQDRRRIYPRLCMQAIKGYAMRTQRLESTSAHSWIRGAGVAHSSIVH